jgi:hypothetical protein
LTKVPFEQAMPGELLGKLTRVGLLEKALDDRPAHAVNAALDLK